jgi:hypothetical protein
VLHTIQIDSFCPFVDSLYHTRSYVSNIEPYALCILNSIHSSLTGNGERVLVNVCVGKDDAFKMRRETNLVIYDGASGTLSYALSDPD